MAFLRQIEQTRRWLTLAIAALLVVCGMVDFTTDFWTRHAFMASAASGALLLALTVLAINEYVNYAAAQRWKGVAAFALEDLGRTSRAVWVRHVGLIQPVIAQMHVVQYKQQLRSAEGSKQHAAALDALVNDHNRRMGLYDVVSETVGYTRELLIRWAPVMVDRGPLADQLSDFVRLNRLMVQAIGFLHHEREGRPLPISPQELAEKTEAITELAMELDDRFFAAAEQTDALYAKT